MNEAQEKAIRDHAENLEKIFPTCHKQGIDLCKWLHRKERKASQLATDYCNGLIDADFWETESEDILQSVNEMLDNHTVDIMVNGDPRGYALKISSEYMRENDIDVYRDWGGYGIISPEF